MRSQDLLYFVGLNMGKRALLTTMTIGLLLSIPPSNGFSQDSAPIDPRVAQLQQSLKRELSKRIASAEQSFGPDTVIGVSVLDANSGQSVFEYKSDARMAAASNAKIITTAAALDILGPEFQFRTELLAGKIDSNGVLKGDLYLRGRGNPAFDDRDMVQMVRSLKALGIVRISGGIVVDNSYFDTENFPQHYDEQPDESAGFRAPISATSYNFNAWTLIARPALAGDGLARIEMIPPNGYIKVVNTLRTIPSGPTSIRLKITPSPGRLLVEIGGNIQKQVWRRRFRKLAPNPTLFVGTGLQHALSRAGIAVRKKAIRAGITPPDARIVAVHQSAPLATMIRGMGKFSNNFVAELLFKVIGAEAKAQGTPATWKHAQEAVADFLSKVEIEAGSYRFDNGSGLFDSNQLSPKQLVRVLQYARNEARWGPDFFASLAIAGADGTLRKRFLESSAERRVRAKTGTLATVSALSGMAATNGNRPLLFSILLNGFAEPEVGMARALQDSIATQLIDSLSK